MDTDVSRTLDELGRKLAELEQTLSALSEPAPAPPPEPEPETGPGPDLGIGPGPAPAGRIVDEAVEEADPPPPPPAATPPPAPPPPPEPATPAAPALGAPIAASAPLDLVAFGRRLEEVARGLTDEYDALLRRLSYSAMSTTTSATISFARGVPSLDIIDVEGLRDASVRAFDSDPEGATAYGTSVGYPRLRNWIAARHGVEPERVLVTNGSLQADAFLFDELVRPGDEVIVESPTYDRTLLSLRHRGAQVHAVELRQDGIDTAALAQLLESGAGPGTKLAHVIPNFQNPAGYTLSLPKRRRLLELAAEHDFIVLEDDPYVDLRFSGEPLPTMVSMDPEHVVYASSFTKTVAPGVRVGYLVGPVGLIADIAKLATNTYISPGMAAQATVYEFCASGALERSIETVRTALSERAQRLGDALQRELPEALFVAPQGGYFLWVTLPAGTDVARMAGLASARGVSFVKGSDFLLEGGENTLRLAYSGVTTDEIDEGVGRLADAYRAL